MTGTEELEVNEVNRLRVCVCVCTYSLAWSLAAYRTLTTAVSMSVFTVGEHTAESIHTQSVTQFTTVDYFYMVKQL